MTHNEQLVVAFVQGVKWWVAQQTGATLWPNERILAEEAAMELLGCEELGLSSTGCAERRMRQREA